MILKPSRFSVDCDAECALILFLCRVLSRLLARRGEGNLPRLSCYKVAMEENAAYGLGAEDQFK